MKDKPEFNIGDIVKTDLNNGTVEAVAVFADHWEYLVRWPDGTAAFVHEDRLTPAAPPAPNRKSSTVTPKSPSL